MEAQKINRFCWSREELKRILMADLTQRGIEVEGEMALSWRDTKDTGVVLEVWPYTAHEDAPQATMFPGEGTDKGEDASE